MGRKSKATDILDNCKMKISGLIDEDNFRKYIDDNVKIKSYLGLMEKNDIINEFMAYTAISSMSNLSPIELTIELEIRYLYNCLFCYTDLKLKPEQRTIANYDIFMNSGLVNIILEKCGNDFEKTKTLIKESFGFNDTIVVKNILNSFNTKQLNDATDRITELLKDKEMVDNLVKISEYNDPTMKKIKDEVIKLEIEKLKESV